MEQCHGSYAATVKAASVIMLSVICNECNVLVDCIYSIETQISREFEWFLAFMNVLSPQRYSVGTLYRLYI